jgi:hypothetical protein
MPKNKNSSPFELLRNKAILEILDGDVEFGTIDDIQISMPYLSGPKIAEISQRFGMVTTYGEGNVIQSRWMYMDELIVHCIAKNIISELLTFLFSEKQFEATLKGKTAEEIKELHSQIINKIIEHINGILHFGEKKLVVSNNKISIISLEAKVQIVAPAVRNVNRDYIKDLSDRAMQDIVNKNYDSAITKARTLLEEVFCYVIEKKEEEPSSKGDIRKLYKQVRGLYNMHTGIDIDRRLNSLLSGLEKIVSSIAEMRNTSSDAHGVGSRRLSIAEHHARLLVNSAMTMAEFIISIENNN